MGAPSGAALAFQFGEVEAGAGVFDAVVSAGAVAFLDLAVKVFPREPFQRRLQRRAARVLVEDRRVDYEGVGEFEGGEVSVERVAYEDGVRGEEGEEARLDLSKRSTDVLEFFRCDAGVSEERDALGCGCAWGFGILTG